MEKIYIIGHKSPDLDSVAGAISYAALKNKIENTDIYVPAILGGINKETEYILNKLKFEIPVKLTSAAGKNLILVDHNEFSQSADGVESSEILEILDHHKVDFKYSKPILINIKPVGSSCSIIASLYKEKNIEIDANIAELMLSAILVDTIIMKSPTGTEFDQDVIILLSQKAGIKDWLSFGMDIFKIRSSVSELSALEIIKSDFKDFNFKQGKIGIGQVETVDLKEFAKKEDELITEINNVKKSEKYHSVVLFITDIINEGSLFLVSSDDVNKIEQALENKLDVDRVYIKGIVSRKKQVAPKFMEVFDK